MTIITIPSCKCICNTTIVKVISTLSIIGRIVNSSESALIAGVATRGGTQVHYNDGVVYSIDNGYYCCVDRWTVIAIGAGTHPRVWLGAYGAPQKPHPLKLQLQPLHVGRNVRYTGSSINTATN